MPRIGRIIAPGNPHHITQRGNNRATVFFDDEDRLAYLNLLTHYASQYKVKIWAYCLMDNHLHLLAVPEVETSLARGVGLANQVYTQYLNRKRCQSGRVWQNRFFSCVVDDDRYLWAVARYIERNPLKPNLVSRPEQYPWSSAAAHLTGKDDEILAPTSWLELSERADYADFVRLGDEQADEAIRKATSTGRPFGSEGFIDGLEHRLGQAMRPRRPGRPRKTGGCP